MYCMNLYDLYICNTSILHDLQPFSFFFYINVERYRGRSEGSLCIYIYINKALHRQQAQG